MKSTARQFSAIMAFAREVEKKDPRGLIAVIRILGMSILADFLRWRMESLGTRHVKPPCPDWDLFPLTTKFGPHGERLDDLCPEEPQKLRIDLAKHLVLPVPWNRDRLAKSLAFIGPKRKWGKWKHDDMNHAIEYWEPIGVGWCINGNHSMVAGIIAGEGTTTTVAVRDITPLYAHVTCDGKNYLNSAGKTIGKVNSPEFAAIFEIGRLLVKHGVSASKR